MSQSHSEQFGVFHITTNVKKMSPWCTITGVPEILIDNLCTTRNLHQAVLIAFCILHDHMHFILSPGEKGLSAFVHSFKRNSSKDIRYFLGSDSAGIRIRAASQSITDDCSRSSVVSHDRSRGSVTAAESDECIFSGWQRGFHDELIRNEKQLEKAQIYVQENAVKHGLVENIEDWPWTSLHFEEVLGEAKSMIRQM